MQTVCTGFSEDGYHEYGSRFLTTFEKFWPKEVSLVYYTEVPVHHPRGECRSLWHCEGARNFLERHRGSRRANGCEAHKCWKPREVSGGYSFRTDVVKFFKQCLIPEHAARSLPDGDILCWLDADVVSHAQVTPNLIPGLLGKENDLCYLGRDGVHPEIGFWAVRLNYITRAFLKSFADHYRTDEVFRLGEWHSAYVFDHVRKRAEASLLMRSRNLTPGGRGHVWMQCYPLAMCTDHLKGKRKGLPKSPERERAVA